MRQAPSGFRRQTVLLETRGTQRIVASDPFGRVTRRDEDPRNAPSGVLGSWLAKVGIERRVAAGKGRAFMMRTERLDAHR
ncbi:MAG: hypothetical protein F4X97_06855 [Boseongicola sp. SB0662_bin_57]|nr:hypothetical protein [Boseongicola sp. SB0662_bin_57]